MGDWSICHHFIVGQARAPRPHWSDKRWAMRTGTLGPGLRLMQTLQKYGYQPLGDQGVISVCFEQDYLGGSPVDAFIAGCNYLLAPPGADERLFEAAQRALGSGAQVAGSGPGRLLSLKSALPFARAHWEWQPFAPAGGDPMAELVHVLAREERSLAGRDTQLISGLWTAEHGYVHTGHLTIGLSQHWNPWAEWVLTGAHNPLQASWEGPYAGSIYIEGDDRPVPLPRTRWPG